MKEVAYDVGYRRTSAFVEMFRLFPVERERIDRFDVEKDRAKRIARKTYASTRSNSTSANSGPVLSG